MADWYGSAGSIPPRVWWALGCALAALACLLWGARLTGCL